MASLKTNTHAAMVVVLLHSLAASFSLLIATFAIWQLQMVLWLHSGVLLFHPVSQTNKKQMVLH